MKRIQRWQDWVSLIFGIWLFITPWIFGFAHTNYSWSPFIFGALIIIFSLWASGDKRLWEEWINAIIAIWIFISPWVLGFSNEPNAPWNMFMVGAVVFILSIWNLGGSKAHMDNTFSTIEVSK